ncbi:hypothetical protein GOBAR_AA34738 [Gossypium barbadense]|uniref:DC1 domain-containing protein n=1 Tax=Gossypium barbadense TaxID=3634 RepID=A0A2P5W4B8_GOSBA|nr:hypothetical protein GOBAR_AA34738 [Gossypium barbadense]
MEESLNYGHQHHLLLLLNEDQLLIVADCSRCGEKVSTPCFSCVEDCGFTFTSTFELSTVKLVAKLEHAALQHPLVSTENGDEELEDVGNCFWCLEPLANYTYFSLDYGFSLHKKCVELSFKLNLVWHRKHPLVLQFNTE